MGICYTNVAFLSNNKESLEDIYENIYSIYKSDKRPLKKIAKVFDVKCPNLTGELIALNKFKTLGKDCYYFIIEVKTDLNPTPQLWNSICKKYKDVRNVYISEEFEYGSCINTDVKGEVFKDKYKLELFFCNESLMKKIFPQSKLKDIELIEYFNTLESLIIYMVNLTGRKFTNFTEIVKYIDNIIVQNNKDDFYIDLYEFTNT